MFDHLARIDSGVEDEEYLVEGRGGSSFCSREPWTFDHLSCMDSGLRSSSC